jgi:glycosyltransferase involved in cell wall biosynthesis
MKSDRGRPTDGICSVTHGDGSNPVIQRTLKVVAANSSACAFLYWDRLGKRLFHPPPDVRCLPVLKGGGRRNLKIPLLLPLFWLKAILLLLRIRPRLVYAHAFEAAVAAWVARRVAGIPYIYHIHDNISISHKWTRGARAFLEWVDLHLIRDAERVVLPDLCRMLPSYKSHAGKFVILPNATDVLFRLPPVSAESGRPLTVAALGSLEITRGLGLLLSATENNREVRVIAAGHVREESAAHAISRQPNWDYRGLVPHAEVERIYAEADVVFLFYKPDLEINRLAVSIKLPEALAAGRPVLINDEVQFSKRILEWGVGYSCAYDIAALRKCLAVIARNRSDLSERSRRALAIYERELKWNVHKPKLEEMLREGGLVTK